jgi:hypothetical protein
MKLFFSALIFILLQMPYTIWNASKATENNWRIVNDGVMGGLSSSKMLLQSINAATFSGQVSLDNNGGFAMVQYDCDVAVKNNHTKLVLKVKGDGKTYQFRIRSNRRDYYSYVQNFTTLGEQEDITLDLKNFYPAFRGRKLQMSNFDQERISQVAILIGNKVVEEFTLDILSIELQ